MFTQSQHDNANTDTARGFLPLLLRVEVSSDMVNPGEDLWITAWWQNVGDAPAECPLQGFLALEFGHQRILEQHYNNYRIQWDPQPAPQYWRAGDIRATTCRWHAPTGAWGGSFRLYLGFCDEEQVPIALCAPDGQPVIRMLLGEIDLGWSYGKPTVELTRKAWSKEFQAQQPRLQSAPAPAPTLTIGDKVTVTLDAVSPILVQLDDGQAVFTSPALLPEVLLRNRQADALISSALPACTIDYTLVAHDGNTARYAGVASYLEQVVARWTLCFAASARELVVTLEDIQDEPGFELLEVRFPSLISSGEPDVQLVDFFGGGRLIDVAATRPLGYVHPYDVRNAAALYTANGTVVLETPHLDDRLYVSVQEDAAAKEGMLGIALVAKVRGRGATASLPVACTPRAEITLLDAGWGTPSWQAVARFLRRDLQPGPRLDLYTRTLVTKQLVTIGPQPEPWQLTPDASDRVKHLAEFRTFAQMHDVMRRIAHLLDGGAFVLYITGWQYRGFDTGYPYVYETDPRLGTIDDLKGCIAAGPRYNAHVGMHDNYDDCYRTPAFDPRMVAQDENGQYWRGWIWAGGQSYITGFHKYVAQGLMQERVRKTVELYGLNTTYHLDVLSSEVQHYDFDPNWPAAADANMAGKFAVIAEFAKYGVDITSETLTHPFIGKMSYAWSTRDNRETVLFPGEVYIPLTAMIYHGLIRFDDGGDRLWGIVRGSGARWSEMGDHEATDVEGYYLQTLPLSFLSDRQMLDCRQEGTRVCVSYGPDSSVEVDFSDRTYQITVDGRLVAHNWTTFVPGFKPGSYLAYALQAGEMRYPAPAEWADGQPLHAVILTGEGDGEEVSAELQAGEVVLAMPAGKPVRVMRT